MSPEWRSDEGCGGKLIEELGIGLGEELGKELGIGLGEKLGKKLGEELRKKLGEELRKELIKSQVKSVVMNVAKIGNESGQTMRIKSKAGLMLSLCAMLLVLLAGCATKKEVVTTYPGNPIPEPEPEPEVIPDQTEILRARVLANLLYDARTHYDNNRLMIPAGNNAYELYQEVLQLDPGNAMAVQGIQDIALRYIALANDAINRGKLDDAAGYLGRSARLGPDQPELATARARLEQARQNTVELFALDAAALSAQNLEIMTQLAEIAQKIQASEATFLISARSDEEGRWIYKTMRDAVGGYRLRGNIDISGTPGVLVTAPKL